MKTTMFCCLRTESESKDQTHYVRAKITVDSLQPEKVDLYVFPGSAHHSCNHEPTSVSQRTFDQSWNHLFRWSMAGFLRPLKGLGRF